MTGDIQSSKTEFEQLKNHVTYTAIGTFMQIMKKNTWRGLKCDYSHESHKIFKTPI
jgi:hypothetical protein